MQRRQSNSGEDEQEREGDEDLNGGKTVFVCRRLRKPLQGSIGEKGNVPGSVSSCDEDGKIREGCLVAVHVAGISVIIAVRANDWMVKSRNLQAMHDLTIIWAVRKTWPVNGRTRSGEMLSSSTECRERWLER